VPRNVPAAGPRNAALMIVGEAPGAEEELHGEPFIGAAGKELNSWLRAGDIRRDDVFVTNVCKQRPPGNKIDEWLRPAKKSKKLLPEGWSEARGMWYAPPVADGLAELEREIADVKPRCIVALGNTPLWALTGETGITEWRGSQLMQGNAALIPMLHPAAVLRQYSWHDLCIHDIKRRVVSSLAGPVSAPQPSHLVNPAAAFVVNWFRSVEAGQWVAVDLETGGGGILCFGFASSNEEALVFDLSRYMASEAFEIDAEMRRTLTRAFVVGQSTCAYDAAWFDWKLNFPLRTDFDTYIAQSVLWPGEPRDLQYLASLHCEHYRKWKDYDDYDAKLATCCFDVRATLEIARKLGERLEARHLQLQFRSRMQYAVRHVYPMARRGVLRCPERTHAMRGEVDDKLQQLQLSIADTVGGVVNIRSPLQVQKALASVGVHVKSTSDDILSAAKQKHPEAADLLGAILEYRSLAALRCNFLSAQPGPDGRLRSQISATGTETFRLTSGKDQFGGGANLLNITEGPPNLRTTIIPDNGYTYFNCDLARADLWAVVWEAADEPLKRAMRDGIDIHLFNCVDLMGITGVPYDEMDETHPNYREHIERHGKRRKNSKQFVHLTNYGGKARTAGISCKMTTHEAELAQRRWFALHPGIKRWHDRTMAQLRGTRRVRNAFGYERPYLGRIESMLPEALAWIPQSTVALVVSYIHMLFDESPLIEVQMQGYDSLAGQFPTAHRDEALAHMARSWRSIVVPYADPFVIPMDLALSESSWGECTKRGVSWPAP
jgi:uracil-DNA glycosylase